MYWLHCSYCVSEKGRNWYYWRSKTFIDSRHFLKDDKKLNKSCVRIQFTGSYIQWKVHNWLYLTQQKVARKWQKLITPFAMTTTYGIIEVSMTKLYNTTRHTADKGNINICFSQNFNLSSSTTRHNTRNKRINNSVVSYLLFYLLLIDKRT